MSGEGLASCARKGRGTVQGSWWPAGTWTVHAAFAVWAPGGEVAAQEAA